MMQKLLLTKRDVAYLLGFSLTQLDRFRFDKDYAHYKFPASVNVGFRVFWRPSDIENWAEAQLSKK
jgi:predicted DNA-binding transcriptional regulator AlpA